MKNIVRESKNQPVPFPSIVGVHSEADTKISQFSTVLGWLIEKDELDNALKTLSYKKLSALKLLLNNY